MHPMRSIASLFALGLMMALFHRVTAGGPLEARATLALGFLLLAAHVGGDLARRARLPRLTGYLIVAFAGGPAWLGPGRGGEGAARRVISGALLAVTVAQDVAVMLLFALVLAAAKPLASGGALNVAAGGTALVGLVGSVAVGGALGVAVERYLRLVRRETVLFLVAVAFLASEGARLLDLGILIVALAAGFWVENFARAGAGERLRSELKRCLVPAAAGVFAGSGARLRLGVLADVWPWPLLFVGVRAVSLRYGVLWAGRRSGVTPVLAREGWPGLISQPGTALALAGLARRAFPEWGVSLEALIVAMIGGHEIAGPVCVRPA